MMRGLVGHAGEAPPRADPGRGRGRCRAAVAPLHLRPATARQGGEPAGYGLCPHRDQPDRDAPADRRRPPADRPVGRVDRDPPPRSGRRRGPRGGTGRLGAAARGGPRGARQAGRTLETRAGTGSQARSPATASWRAARAAEEPRVRHRGSHTRPGRTTARRSASGRGRCRSSVGGRALTAASGTAGGRGRVEAVAGRVAAGAGLRQFAGDRRNRVRLDRHPAGPHGDRRNPHRAVAPGTPAGADRRPVPRPGCHRPEDPHLARQPDRSAAAHRRVPAGRPQRRRARPRRPSRWPTCSTAATRT